MTAYLKGVAIRTWRLIVVIAGIFCFILAIPIFPIWYILLNRNSFDDTKELFGVVFNEIDKWEEKE